MHKKNKQTKKTNKKNTLHIIVWMLVWKLVITKVYGNTKMRQIEINGIPSLCLFAVSIFPQKLKSDMTIKHLACGGEKQW